MTNILEGVVLRGTGANASVPGYHLAGKTGTAKKALPGGAGYTQNEYFASFGGFGPLREPALVGFVLLDTPRGGFYYGGQVAAPVFARIMADALTYLRVPPDDDPWEARREEIKRQAEEDARARSRSKARPKRADEEKPAPPTLRVTAPGQVPDLRGKALREAVAGLVARGYRARVEGEGVVVRQSPPPGTGLASGQACTLRLGSPEDLLEEGRAERAAAKRAAERETAALVAQTRVAARPLGPSGRKR